MGELMNLGDLNLVSDGSNAVTEAIAERSPDFWLPADDEPKKEWKVVVDHFAAVIDGTESLDSPSLPFEAWQFDARPIMEHAAVYAACKAGDTDGLCFARSICSQGVTLRPNSPEEWWRYSIVLGLLGDQVASENALATSVSFGAGQGAKRV